jgi:ABC-type glycerol-3-phosphate transport system substrate-binding protein
MPGFGLTPSKPPASRLSPRPSQTRNLGSNKYFIQPEINNERLKVGLGRNVPMTPAIVKADSWWFADPHRKAYTEQSVFGPTVPAYWAFNPAYAEVQNTHIWSAAWADIMRNGMAPEAAAEKAFRQIETIFAKYPIAQS